MSNDYVDGVQGREFTGTNIMEYQRGRRDGGWAVQGGGSGAGMLVLVGFVIMLALLALPVAIAAVITTFATALFLIPIVRFWGGPTLSYFTTLGISFRANMNYAVVTFVACFIWLAFGSGGDAIRKADELNNSSYFGSQGNVELKAVEPTGSFIADAIAAIDLQPGGRSGFLRSQVIQYFPGLLLSALVFRNRIGQPFSGLLGYMKALITAAVVIFPAFYFCYWGATILFIRLLSKLFS